MAPAGRFEDVTHLIAPRFCAANITPHRAVFPKSHLHNFVSAYVFGQTVLNGFLGDLLRKGAE